MKCEFCEREITKETAHRSQQMKFFCKNIDCIELYYLAKITELDKESRKWRSAWYDARDLIGDMGIQYVINPLHEKNKELLLDGKIIP